MIVITGSSRGIGQGLARSFLAMGHAVMICGRNADHLHTALLSLQKEFDPKRIAAQPCDVTDHASVQALWMAAVQSFGRVDIWINNAGLSHPEKPFWEQSPETIQAVTDTNIRGTMNGAKVAISGMLAQGGGHLFNMWGLGSNGMMVKGFTLYGTTKYAMTYFTKALVKEVKGTSVRVGSISPGMVATDLLIGDYKNNPERFAKMKRIFNILADEVSTVTPWLARQVLQSTHNGARIAWLSKGKIVYRFLSAPFVKRKIIP